MSQSDMVIFNQYFMPAIAEKYAQMIDKFNASSSGTLQLSSAGFDGDYLQESFYKEIFSAGRRVDRSAANTTQTATPLTQAQHNTVKVAGGFGPVLFEPSQMTWLRKPTQEGITVASDQFAQSLMADQLNTVIASLVAAIGNNAAMVNDVSSGAVLTQSALNNTHAKFGDMSQMLVGQVMSGSAYHDLIGEALDNGNRLFSSDTVTVVDILGKSVIVTDAPALTTAGTPNVHNVLSLATGAGVVSDGSDVITNIETTNGKKRIETTMQADYTFGVGLKGYSWDTAAGGSSPSDAALATGTNWEKVVASDKHTAGVLTIADASA
jgi:hypothetical protein